MELNILEHAPVDARIRKLVVGVCDARTELAKVQFEPNINIVELELRAQPLTPPEVREQREEFVKDAIATVDAAVKDFTSLFEQPLELVTSLQEDPNVQQLETEEMELQLNYDEVKATTCTITITWRLAKLQEAKALKEQVDAT